jgi:hypothetical protein
VWEGIEMKFDIRNWITGCLIVVCCASSMTKSHQVNLLFDSLFPVTWYQKGLEASLCAWQTLVNFFEQNNDKKLLSFDLLLARLVFAQFCIHRMYQEDNICREDDNAYFIKVLHRVRQLLSMITITSRNEDFVLCAEDMLQIMQKQLDGIK